MLLCSETGLLVPRKINSFFLLQHLFSPHFFSLSTVSCLADSAGKDGGLEVQNSVVSSAFLHSIHLC